MRTYSHIVVGAGALGERRRLLASEVRMPRWSGPRAVRVRQRPRRVGGPPEDHPAHSYHSADYTALTPAICESWEELEEETGLRLVLRTGGLDLATRGTPGVDELANYRAALRVAGIPWEDLDTSEVRSRYPQWQIEDDVVGMYQEDTGVLDIRRACAAQIARAREMGTVPPAHPGHRAALIGGPRDRQHRRRGLRGRTRHRLRRIMARAPRSVARHRLEPHADAGAGHLLRDSEGP